MRRLDLPPRMRLLIIVESTLSFLVTAFEYLLQDYHKNTAEDDLSHLDEIMQLHASLATRAHTSISEH